MAKRLTTASVTSLPPSGELARLRAVIADQQNMIDELADGHVAAVAQSLPPSVARLLTDLLDLERSRARLDALVASQDEATADYRRTIATLEKELGAARTEIGRLTEALAQALKQQTAPYRPSSAGEGRPSLSRAAGPSPKRRPRAA